MTAERRWGAVWLTLFLILLVALAQTLLPQVTTVQLALIPSWIVYWLLTRGWRLGLWVTLWGGALLETVWMIPPCGVILFFLLLWQLIRTFREDLPEEITPLHGLLVGVILAPLLRLWLWVYAMLWMGEAGTYALAPSLTEMVLMPATGALGGGLVFALAMASEFRVLIPPKETVRGDED